MLGADCSGRRPSPTGCAWVGSMKKAIADPDPTLLVARLAGAKARAVLAVPGPRRRANDGKICQSVLACDSMLEFRGEVYGKPRDGAEAMARWSCRNGQWADFHTGHFLLQSTDTVCDPTGLGCRRTTVATRVQFTVVDRETIGPMSTPENRWLVQVGLPRRVVVVCWWSGSTAVSVM